MLSLTDPQLELIQRDAENLRDSLPGAAEPGPFASSDMLGSSADLEDWKWRVRMRSFGAAAVAGLLVLAGCQQNTQSPAAVEWQEFAPSGRGFSVLLPGTPTEESTSEATAFGVIVTALFKLEPEGEKLAYGIRYDNYPPQVVALLRDASTFLLARHKRLEVEVKGETIDEKDVFVDGYTGKQITLELSDGKLGIYRLFVIDQEMYQLSVKAAPEDASAEEITRFLETFKLL